MSLIKLSASVIVLLSAAVSIADPSSAVVGDTIKIGSTAPLTGGNAVTGLAAIHGAQALLKRLNSSGGVNGRKIEFVVFDDGYEPEKAIANFAKLVNDEKVLTLMTVFGGATTAALMPLAERENITLLGPVSSANISSPPHKNVFAVRPNAYHEAEALVNHLVDDLGKKNIAVFYQDDAFGTAGKAAADKALNARGLQLKAKGAYKRNTIDVAEAVKAIGDAKPDAVLMFGLYPATSEFVNKLYATGVKPIIAGPAAMATPPFFRDTASVKTDYFAALPHPAVDDTSVQVVSMYQADMKAAGFTDVNQFGLDGYIDGLIFAEAVKRMGNSITRDHLRSTLEAMKSVDFYGVKIGFSPSDHQGIQNAFLARYRNGKLMGVKNFKD
jgi:branched-chain amino acid transport system substrate-binding protein